MLARSQRYRRELARRSGLERIDFRVAYERRRGARAPATELELTKHRSETHKQTLGDGYAERDWGRRKDKGIDDDSGVENGQAITRGDGGDGLWLKGARTVR